LKYNNLDYRESISIELNSIQQYKKKILEKNKITGFKKHTIYITNRITLQEIANYRT